ncbi:hypothetical protein V1264_013696 [Littorina saxatilis]|uniref:Tc1-like transposase DDE domain-containing protein n=1 Tax=Littorina saxatilis TaxID=31220 RepID=A0AAN9BQ65_9CAEN
MKQPGTPSGTTRDQPVARQCAEDLLSETSKTAVQLEDESSLKDIAWRASSGPRITSTGTGDNGETLCSPIRSVTALVMLMGVSECGKEEVNAMLMTASWNTMPRVDQTSWSGVESASTKPCDLCFSTILVLVGETASQHSAIWIRSYSLMSCPFSRPTETVLQQDNARSHTARVSQAFLEYHNIDIMAWPALRPDLNPIEHFWDQLQRELNQILPGPRTTAELRQALIQAWGNIPRDAINRLINSMRRRCQAVINVNGGHTPY